MFIIDYRSVKCVGLGDAIVLWIKAYLTGRVSIVHVGEELHSNAL